MADFSVFDIAGPIMIGPSSSHTAGALKLGLTSRHIFGSQPKQAIFNLHGSFAQVYAGHATDRALLGGMLGFPTDDPRIKSAFEEAKTYKLDYDFPKINLGKEAHANTVKIVMNDDQDQITVIGESIGGGMINVSKIDQFQVRLPCSLARTFVLIIWHNHAADFLDRIQGYIFRSGVELNDLQTHRNPDNIESALTIISTLEAIPSEIVETIKAQPEIFKVRVLDRIPV